MKEETPQIVQGRFYYQAQRNPEYQVHYDLFKIGLTLTLDDWRRIRTPEYWVAIDKFKWPNQRAEFTLNWLIENK